MKIWKFGNDVNTDEIIPGRYNLTTNPKELALHCFIEVEPGFSKKVQKGDLLVAGRNFGCGSSREHAVIAIKNTGIRAVIAKSFARIFFRNAINNGLAVIECPNADKIKENDEVAINYENSQLIVNKKNIPFTRIPGFVLKVQKEGGIIPLLKKESFEEVWK
jgi:3-isopropylmalate/(R)-2-methylmalate dehydratase small subunit